MTDFETDLGRTYFVNILCVMDVVDRPVQPFQADFQNGRFLAGQNMFGAYSK